jgi:hypothetical protein
LSDVEERQIVAALTRIADSLEKLMHINELHLKAVVDYSEFEKERAVRAQQEAEQIKTMMFGGGRPPMPQPPAPEPPSHVSGPAGPPGARRRR